MVSDEQVVVRLRELLVDADNETTTGSPRASRLRDALVREATRCSDSGTGPALSGPVAAERQLRKKLEAEFGVDLSDRKGVLREEVRPLPLERAPRQLGQAAAGWFAPHGCVRAATCIPAYAPATSGAQGGCTARPVTAAPRCTTWALPFRARCLCGCCLLPPSCKTSGLAMQTWGAHTRPCKRAQVAAGQQPRGCLWGASRLGPEVVQRRRTSWQGRVDVPASSEAAGSCIRGKALGQKGVRS